MTIKKLHYLTFILAVLYFPFQTYACMGKEEQQRLNIRYLPDIYSFDDAKWPEESDVTIGTILSFLVPIKATVELKHLEHGSIDPLTIFDNVVNEQIRTFPDLVPPWEDITFDKKKFRWVHINTSSYGVSEVRMKAPDGWMQNMTFHLVYPSPLDSKKPPIAITLTSDKVQKVDVRSRDNIEVTVPGLVSDTWSITQEEKSGFRLIQIQQVNRLYGEPRVKLFLAGTANPKETVLVIRRGSGLSAKSYKIELNLLPSRRC